MAALRSHIGGTPEPSDFFSFRILGGLGTCAGRTTTDAPIVEASDIQDAVPSEILSLDPASASSIATAADSFIASVTAAPAYSSVISVLATGIPATAQAAIANDPNSILMDIARGSPVPDWATELPPSVGEYFQSIGEDAARVITSDFGALYTSVSSEVADAVQTGGYAFPTGGYGTANVTAPRPIPTGFAPNTTTTPFEGAASRSVGSIVAAVAAAGMGLGAWLLL
ncbi:MAG: hypothetical protein LQ344_004277 [Seirophora lacunosa]|nr:MAG: hypothetical protein LQ344_004277 [Seirophora lacunosa]